MKRIVSILVACLFAGCLGGRPNVSADSSSGRAHDALPVDSFRFGECTECTGYFSQGALNRQALETVGRILFESCLCVVPIDDCADVAAVGSRQTRALDSLRALAWPDGEPWAEMRRLFLAWSERQFERERLLYCVRRDPTYLNDFREADSMMRCCGGILTGPGECFVDAVRRLGKAREQLRFAHDSSALRYSLALVDRRLSGPDSLDEAREMLFRLLSNHLNGRIHRTLGTDGRVDFCRYEPDFRRLFDSVRTEEWEP